MIAAARFALCAALALSACSTTTAPTSNALRHVDAAALRSVVERTVAALMVPGAMVVLRTPQGDFDVAVGTTDVATRTPPTPGTHFRIASNTKTMTAALIVLLAQDGRLSFDDPVSDYVANVPDGPRITVRQLLQMRSGLFGYTADPALATAMDADPRRSWSPREVLDVAFRHPPQFAPDASYEYSNTNYALLGLVAERAGGRPLAEQFADRLFTPLGLAQTSLPAPDDTALPAPYSHGYMYGGSFYALADDPYPADLQAAARDGTVMPIDYTHQNPSYATAAGGAISTADDLAAWIRDLVTGKVFDADHRRQWLASLRAEDPTKPDGQRYGYGISYQRFGPKAAMYYHGGELPGFNSFMGYDPDNDVTLVIWTNLTLSPDGRTTAQALLPTMLDQIYTGLELSGAGP